MGNQIVTGSTIVTSGTISDLTIAAGGILTVNSGGTADSILVDSGQEINFGQASATTIEQGGVLTVSSGGAHQTTISSGGDVVVASGGQAHTTTVLNGGTFVELPGANVVNLTISSGGDAFINGGATATEGASLTGAQVDSGGIIVISPTTPFTFVDGVNLDNGGYAIVLPGPGNVGTITGSGTVVSTGVALLEPGSGVTTYAQNATSLEVGSGATEWVLPGGVAQGGTVDPGASQQIFAGGTANAVVLSHSFQTVNSGASASGTNVDQGAVQYVYSGGTASATTVNSGGLVAVDSGGSATGMIVNNGGIEAVDGAVFNTTVNSGGEESVVFSGSSTDTTINSGGYAYVFGTAVATQIGSGGYEVVEGEAISAVVSSGGILLDGYPLQLTNPPSVGLVSAATISSGGLEVVFAGSTDSSTTVESGGTYVALPGASVVNLTSIAGAAVICTGVVLFEPSATVTLEGPTFNGQTLTSGMSDYVLSTGIESGTTITNHGYSEIGSGGTATDTTIEGGGTLSFAPGGFATGTIDFAGAGGTLDIQGQTLAGGVTIDGFAPGDVMRFDAVTGKTSTVHLIGGNTLEVSNGTVTVDLQVASFTSGGTFEIDPTDNGATVTISQASSVASTSGQPSDPSVVPVDLPLYVVPFNGGYKIGIQVSLDGGTTYHMYEFDTGGTGFYTAYSPDMAGAFSVVSPAPVVNTYASGNTYTTQIVSTNVTFQTTTGGTVSVNNADIGLITAAQNPGQFTTQQWNSDLTGTPSSTPPLEQSFYGDFGLALRPGLGVDAILPQISGGLSNGYIITVGNYPNGINGQVGSIQVGLTPQDISSFTTLIPMQGQNTLDLFPYSNEPTYDEAQASGTLTLQNGGTSSSTGVGYIFDTGTPTMKLYESEAFLQPFLNNGTIIQGTTITNTATAAAPGDSAWNFSFQQGDNSGQNEAVTGSASNTVNTGLNPFFGYRIMFDLADGLMGFAPLPCFSAGTHLMTPQGEVAVEALRADDEVVTIDGKAKRVVWIGRRTVDCRRHPSPKDVLPVRIRAHAFGLGMPSRDLFLSPDHALFVEATLIPVKYLINGSTVAQVSRTNVTYYHIELARHDVVLADGLPAETYLETGLRAAFETNGRVVQAHPMFTANGTDGNFHWEAFGYAPLTVTGPALERAKQKLRRHEAELAAPSAMRRAS